jgi:hypothetical protein
VIEGFNGLKGGKFDPGLAGAISDILESYAQDKDNKLMIAFRLKTDFPPKPPDWPRLAGVPRAPAAIVSPAAQTETAKISGGVGPAGNTLSPSTGPTPAVVAEQTKMAESPQTAPAAPPSAVAKADPQTPQLQERNPQTTQPTTSPRTRWADPEFGEQIVALIASHMKGLDDSSVRAKVLQTMVNTLIIVRDPNPTFHSRVSAIDLKNPNPEHFEFTVNKTEYFDALVLLGRRDKMAQEVIWSTFAENAATVEYAAGNPDFGPFYKTLQSDLSTAVKRHTNVAEVSPEIFDDPQFKALLPYYTTFWSNWQFAGEQARFQYLHDRVSSKRLRQLADEAGNDSETRAVRGDLLGLADEVDLFYGDAKGIPDAVPAVETNRAGLRANSMDSIALAREPDRESEPKVNRPANMGPAIATATKMKQFTSVLERVEDPSKERLQSQDAYRRAFIIRLMVDAWGRTSPEQQKKLLAGQWSGADLRFVLAILSEIQAKRLTQELDSNAIVRLSKDMPWIVDSKFELTNGALERLPATLKGQP